ncbi:terpene synthase [Wallemia mellicola]|nr:terpene synthase [Wallemia mellicola]
MNQGFKFYKQIQSVDGHWAGEYGGPMFLLPGLVISNYISGVKLAEEQRVEIIRYLFNRAHADDGGWGIHIESLSTVFGTALNYTALRLLGVEADHPIMTKARGTLHKFGGATGAPAWGKFWLACLGVYDWDGVNPVPPELWLLPDWLPIHPTRWWIHCRQIYLPMSYLYGKRFAGPSTKLTEELKEELYVEPYASINWPAQRNNVNKIDLFQPHSAIMDALNAILYYGYESCAIPPLRQAALRKAYEHIVHEDENTSYQGLAPINKAFNQLCRLDAEGADSEAVKKHVEKSDDFLWLGPDGLRETGTNGSQLWDAAFIAQALVETGLGEEEENKGATEKLLDWLDKCQIRQDPPYPAYRQPTKGAWPFSTAEQGYTVSDCTAEGIKSVIFLQEHLKHTKQLVSYERLQESVDLLLGMQNADGGFASYELTRGSKHLELLNPAEVFGKIMVEYSYPECTTSVVTALSLFKRYQPNYRREEIEKTTAAAIKYIHAAQRQDGSWYGSWAICFTYAAMFALESLSSVGEHYDNSEKVKKACEFLLSKQKEDGGWGESYLSCELEEYTHHENSQVVQTSWVILALLHAKYPHKEPIKRAVRLIMSRQNKDGSWTQEAIEGIFNKNCAISYPNYKFSFTIWALAASAHGLPCKRTTMASQPPIPPPAPKPLPLGYESPKDKAYRKFVEQPLVPIGIGATIIALTRAAMEIRRGNSRAANKFFRYRVYAQGATVVAAVGGMWYYGTAQEQKGARIERDRIAQKEEFERRLSELDQESVSEQAHKGFKKHSEAPSAKASIADLDLSGTSWEKLPAASPPMPNSGSEKVVKTTEGHNMPIRLLEFTPGSKQLVSTGDDKQLNLWDIQEDKLKLKDTIKRANSLKLLDEHTILVGDKFGDIFAYKLNRTEEDKEKDKEVKNKDKEPLLGHVSMVNDFTVTPSHIISADRDAHIRVSRNPLGYVIDNFCLGHSKFVTAIGLLNEDILLSGGGDDFIILWDWKNGKEIKRFDIREAVLSHASVRAIRINDKMLKSDNIPADYGEHIICIDRILVGSGEDPLVAFTSCGATGVFYARRSSFLDTDKEFNIQAVDLQHPIIDLAEVSGKYVATLDTSRGANDAVAVLTLNSDGELQSSQDDGLVNTLNSLTVEGSEKDVKQLDLYSQLALQPKVEGEDDLNEKAEHPDKSGRTGEKRRAREATKQSNQAKKTKTEEPVN